MHGHTHAAAEAPGAAAPGASPLLDIGGDVGALVVYLDAVTPSGELQACPAGRPGERFHTGVHLRDLGAGRVAAAVYPQVRRGRYQILDDRDAPVALVRVDGGRVSELDLRSA